jgi:hypothetical protein
MYKNIGSGNVIGSCASSNALGNVADEVGPTAM